MLGEVPIAEEVLELFKNYCCADISITAFVPKVAVQIYATTEGILELTNLILGE